MGWSMKADSSLHIGNILSSLILSLAEQECLQVSIFLETCGRLNCTFYMTLKIQLGKHYVCKDGSWERWGKVKKWFVCKELLRYFYKIILIFSFLDSESWELQVHNVYDMIGVPPPHTLRWFKT